MKQKKREEDSLYKQENKQKNRKKKKICQIVSFIVRWFFLGGFVSPGLSILKTFSTKTHRRVCLFAFLVLPQVVQIPF